MIKSSIVIDASHTNVMQAFYDLRVWVDVLPDIQKVNLLYGDSRHQVFSMAVVRPQGIEKVEGIRFKSADKIFLYQTTPPPGFKSMQGIWQIRKLKNNVMVVAKRFFALTDPTKKTQVAEQIQKYLSRNLQCFKEYLEC